MRIPDAQRLGYLLDLVGARALADPLAEWLSGRPRRSIFLRPDGARDRSELNRRWRVYPNEDVEADL